MNITYCRILTSIKACILLHAGNQNEYSSVDLCYWWSFYLHVCCRWWTHNLSSCQLNCLVWWKPAGENFICFWMEQYL